MVMLLDAAMRLAISAQSGPQPRLEVPGRRRRGGTGWLALGGAGALIAVAGAAVIITALLNGPADLSSLAPHAPTRTPVASAPASPSASAGPSASAAMRTPASPPSPAPGSQAAAPPAAPPALAVPLTARYSAADGGIGLLGYTAGVTIANPGPAGRDGWRITLTLPRPTLQIAEVSGAVASQDGATWTFEPDETTRTVPAHGSVEITFQVRGATLLTAAPRDCRIDDRPCGGVGASPPSSG
jgi:hypothetical protein